MPGVSEVVAIGGFVKQYQIEVDPGALLHYGIPLSKVRQAIKESNKDVGGRLIEMAETEYMVRSRGYAKSIEDFKSIAVAVSKDGVPIRLEDIADIKLGPELRRGLAELNGEGEVAGGVVVMRFGENAMATIGRVREKLEELKASLPEGVEIVTTYDRRGLIERAIGTLSKTLSQVFVIVSLVCIVFLFHLRSSLVVIISLPIGVLIAFIVMKYLGINANIMSLGGIAITIGTMVDGAIVLIENTHKHLERRAAEKGTGLTTAERWQAVRAASVEVGPALFFTLVIITVSYIVIFSLQGQERRLFGPLAFTSTFSMAAAAILAVTLVPVLMGYLVRGKIIPESKNPINRGLHFVHSPIFGLALRWPRVAVLVAITLVAATWYPLSKLGSEFMPPIDEGDILYMPTTYPGISITKAKEILQQTDKILATFPEVKTVFGKVGRAETATDPAPLSMIETTVQLYPRSEWPDPDKTTRQLMSEMDQAIKFPGLTNAWTMPIKTRIDMLATGIKTPVGIKVSGPDLSVLQEVSTDIERAMKTLPETLSAFGDRAVGGYFVDFDIDREAA
ncbi:MAG: efflux RND transporter permease subunit, partial [Pseudomonadales bacterium]